MGNIKLGVAPTRRDMFIPEEAVKYKNLVLKKLKELNIDFVDLEWLNEEGILMETADVDKVIKRFQDEKVDAVFTPHCNFGNEACVARLGRALKKPLLLWGPRDDAPLADGLRQRDSQCGMFATSKVLQRYNVPFSYIVNSRVDDEVFVTGLKRFIAAAGVVKTFQNMRIGQIGTRPESFLSVIYNEGSLLEKFGIEVVPIPIPEFIDRAKALMDGNDLRLEEGIQFTKKRIPNAEEDFYRKHAAIKYALKDFAAEKGLSAIAFQCWNAMQTMLNIMPCYTMSELVEEGLPVICETDVSGAVTAAMVQAAVENTTPLFFADVTVRHPTNDNAELLWHCGPFPYSLKKEGAPADISKHYTLSSQCCGAGEWQLKDGEMTICRMDETNGKYKMLLAKCKTCDGPKNRGTYVWAEFSDWEKLEQKLMYGPYIHHVAGIYADIIPVMQEAVRFLPDIELDIFE